MASTDLGKVKALPKGTWSNSATYEKLDIVSKDGSSYIALQDVPAGTAVTDTSYWQLLAAKGETGDTGAVPAFTIGTVATGEAGSSAAASITGTDKDPVLNLTIPQGLKGDAGNGDMIADDFSTSKAYAAGEYVIYNGHLYRFTAAHAAGAWSGSDATEVQLAEDVTDLKNTIDNQADGFNVVIQEENNEIILDGNSFMIGNLNSSGETTDSNLRIRSKDFIACPSGKNNVYVPSGFSVRIFGYDINKENGTEVLPYKSSNVSPIEIDFGNHKYFKFVMFVTNATETPVTSETVKKAVYVIRNRELSADETDFIGTAINKVDGTKVITPFEFEYGSITSSGLVDNTNARIRSKDYYPYYGGIDLYFTNDVFEVCFIAFNSNKEYVSTSVFYNSDGEITLENCAYYKMVLKLHGIREHIVRDDLKYAIFGIKDIPAEITGDELVASDFETGGIKNDGSHSESPTRKRTIHYIPTNGENIPIKFYNNKFTVAYRVYNYNSQTGEYNHVYIGLNYITEDAEIPCAAYTHIKLVLQLTEDSSANITDADMKYAVFGLGRYNPDYLDSMTNVMPVHIKCCSYNVGHYNGGSEPTAQTDWADVIQKYRAFFSNLNADILAIAEEQTAYGAVFNADNEIYKYLYPYRANVTDWTCIKSRFELFGSGTGAFNATGRKYKYAYIKAGTRTIFVMVLHFYKNMSGREDEYQELLDMLEQHEYFIVMGDFNAGTGDQGGPEEYESLTDEGYQIANGGYLGWFNTYINTNDRYLDNIVTSPNIVIANCYVADDGSHLTSDHLPFVADLVVY